MPLELYEQVARCSADHVGEWHGEWQECRVVARHGDDTCDVCIFEDGTVRSSF